MRFASSSMTAPSTNSRSKIESDLNALAAGVSCYYIKSSTIVERIYWNGRVFYSKFRRYDAPVTPILIRQHLDREITLAIPLLNRGKGKLLLFEYFGEEPKLFISTLKHLFEHLQIKHYSIYKTQREKGNAIVVPTSELPLEELHIQGEKISKMLQRRLEKSWRVLPDKQLPEAYNIFTLPCEYIN